MSSLDDQIRVLVFAYTDLITHNGQIPVTSAQLNQFRFQGQRVPLSSQSGVFKPAILDYPISIRTTYRAPGEAGPYEDEVVDGLLHYRYMGTDPNHAHNSGLRQAMEDGIPMLYLKGVARGLYHIAAAVIVEDWPGDLTFGVELYPIDAAAVGIAAQSSQTHLPGRHSTAMVKVRIGQAAFRESVLKAYAYRCTLCRLGHRTLLDAAHITPFATGGSLTVPNGMSMCKIHHAAYDANIIGVRPDYVAEVRTDILAEVDGPMLRHGLQEVHGARLHPSQSLAQPPRPSRPGGPLRELRDCVVVRSVRSGGIEHRSCSIPGSVKIKPLQDDLPGV